MVFAKILLADREGELREKWKSYLESQGLEVIVASTLLEAQEKCLELPDGAIVDLELSQEGDSLGAGRAIHGEVGTIIITNSRNDQQAMREAFVYKPGYLPAVKDFIGKWEGVEEVHRSLRQRVLTPRVFVAHGHDNQARHEVERFLQNLEFRPIILVQEAEMGRTIIEKIERYSNVDFAIVLLTPDDFGGTDPRVFLPRARQNVIFEFGFFVAKLGRKKVVALYKKKDGELEIPSNYSGVLHIDMDPSGGWKMQLAKELRAANFNVDLSKVLRS